MSPSPFLTPFPSSLLPIAYDLQTVGALHLQMGNGLKALDYLDRALKMDPTHLLTQLNRAKALLMLGYKRQGLVQALALESAREKEIASQASASFLPTGEISLLRSSVP